MERKERREERAAGLRRGGRSGERVPEVLAKGIPHLAAEPAPKQGVPGSPHSLVPVPGGCGGGWRWVKAVLPQSTHKEPGRSLAVGAGWLRDPSPGYFGLRRYRRRCGELRTVSLRRGERLLLHYFYRLRSCSELSPGEEGGEREEGQATADTIFRTPPCPAWEV